MSTLTRDIRNIIDAKVTNGDPNVVAEVLKSFATILSGFADSESECDNEDEADRLMVVSDSLVDLSKIF